MFNSIASKLITLIFAAILPMIFGITYFSYKYSSSLLIEKAERQAELQLQNTEYIINIRTVPIQKIPAGVAANLPDTPEKLEALIVRTLDDNQDIFGMAAAFEPNSFIKERKLYSPYVYKDKGKTIISNLDTDDYNYPEQEWYKTPKLKHEATWSEPYYDKGGGNIMMSTYSYPLYQNSSFKGVVTADISLEDLTTLIRRIKILETGYAFLISKQGMVMAHSDDALVMSSKKLSFTNIILSNKNSSASSIETDKNIVWFKQMKSTGWYAGVVFPKNELFAPVYKLNYILMLISISCAGVILLAITLISKTVTSGMKDLADSASNIANGHFDTPMQAQKGNDELSKLSESFETMRKSLIEYIENLRITENAKQKIENELTIAKDIQLGLLPKIFPPFPDRDDVDIYASMSPAREVGGDLYDFYFLDENKLCLLIGDVSGKGVPASLFMAVSKTLIKAVADKNVTAGNIFTKVNSELADENDNCMFVTAFIGIIDIQTGEMSYANAGHNPPILVTGSEVNTIESDLKPPLGAFDSVKYDTFHTKLNINDKLFLYTDGVTEAMNSKNEEYTTDKLLKLLSEMKDNSSKLIIESVTTSVKEHVKDAEQHDDITMLCFNKQA